MILEDDPARIAVNLFAQRLMSQGRDPSGILDAKLLGAAAREPLHDPRLELSQ